MIKKGVEAIISSMLKVKKLITFFNVLSKSASRNIPMLSTIRNIEVSNGIVNSTKDLVVQEDVIPIMNES